MKKALIMNIQRYSLHDGSGIRTVVFFKGCPLTCPWCSNPESQSFEKEIFRKESLCIKCSSESCILCEMKPDDCPTGALDIVGKEYSIKELVEEVKKDMVFYESTGGGVTISGGEPLLQGEFAIEFLKELKKIGINTAIETTGFGKWEILDEISDYLDTALFDLKIMDCELSKRIVNADINLIKFNFERLVKKGMKVIPRIPLIPGYTDSYENINELIKFVKAMELKEIHLLPFHQYGRAKYKAIGKEYTLMNLKTLIDDEINNIKEKMESHNLKVFVGGE